MKNKILFTLTVLLLAQLIGCQKPQPVTNPMSVNSSSENIWMACKDELRSRGFSIDFQNRQAGIIETRPLISKQWFEFWKNDVVDNKSLAKSSIQTTNRIVMINIDDQSKPQSVKCTVTVNKLYTTSIADSKQARSEDAFVATQYLLEKKSDSQQYWEPAGNDPALEEAILRSIKSKLK